MLEHDQVVRAEKRLLVLHVQQEVRVAFVEVVERHALDAPHRLGQGAMHARLVERRMREQDEDAGGGGSRHGRPTFPQPGAHRHFLARGGPPRNEATGMRRLAFVLAVTAVLAASTGCSDHHTLTRVEQGNRDGVLYLGNAGEPRELDPQLTTGIPEFTILHAIGEGLVNADGKDLHPTPAVAQSWEASPDSLTYTFHLRPDARWSNGAPLTARDFVASFKRVLSPKLGAEFSYYLWVLKNAEAYNHGEITDFDQVGVHAPDDLTVRLDLEHPTPYLFNLLMQRTCYPVYLPNIEKFGAMDDRTNLAWTKPENFVGNGAFVLTEWKINEQIVVRKNPKFWNAAHVRLNEIHFYPIDSGDTEERDFRAGLLHKTSSSSLPPNKIDLYHREHPQLLRIDPYLGSYYYMLNTTRPPLDDVRVRLALAMSIDRASLVKNVARGGQRPSGNFVPAWMPDWQSTASIPYDPGAARQLLADAGHAGGAGLPPIDVLFNTSENHRQIAEAIQAMWKKELGVEIRLNNSEWKVYLNARKTMDYSICRAGWIGSWLTPSAFLENFLARGLNNNTGFASPEYDRLLMDAQQSADPARRLADFQKAEAILLEAAPVIPMFDYVSDYLLQPSVKNWDSNLLDYHPYEDVCLQP